MKKVFIYYSLSGNGDLVASSFKEKGYDIRKIITKKKMPDNFTLRILSGGFKAFIKYKEPLDHFDYDISEYDEVIIGSPVWNGRLSSPINTVLSKLDLRNKKITFVFYSGSGDALKLTEKIREKYHDSEIIHLKEPKKNLKELEKIKNK